MATEKQVLANRLNAQKSTGPKTPEGKATSRGNALKHGLAGSGVGLSETDCVAYTARLKTWHDDLQPKGVVETWLVRSAVAASVRVDRCQRAEWAELERVRRVRIQAWEDEQEERLKAILPENPSEIGGVLCFLEQFSTGCEWLLTAWKVLRGRFVGQGFLYAEELADILSLLGLEPGKMSVPDTREHELAQLNDCAREGGEGAADSRRALGARIDQQIEDLKQLAYGRWGMEESRWLNEDIDREAFDDTPRGQLLRRYETASRNDVQRTLAHLARIRKDGVLHTKTARFAFRAATQPAAEAPEPKPEAGLRNEANSAGPIDVEASLPTTCTTKPSSASARGDQKPRRADEAQRRMQVLEVARASNGS